MKLPDIASKCSFCPGIAACLGLLLAAAPSARAVEYTTASGLRLSYETENGEARVTKVHNVPDNDIITIPESLGGHPVTTIGENAGVDGIVSFEIKLLQAESVETIKRGAFNGFILLREIDFPKVVTVEGDAFSGCKGMHTISLPLVETVESQAFADCAKLKKLDLPEATSIGSSAFSQCDLLDEIYLPKLTELGRFAFSGPNMLQKVALGALETIGVGAFDQCGSLHTVELPLVEAVESTTFYKCPKLKNVSLPRAKSVGDSAFQGCGNLEDIRLPLVESLGAEAFSGCGILRTVLLPAAESIGDSAFVDCEKLSGIYFGQAPTVGESAFENTGQGWTAYYHAEHAAHFESGEWSNSIEVAHPFAGPVEISTGEGSATVRIRYARDQLDWSHVLERTTDLRDPLGWAEAMPRPGKETEDGFTVESLTLEEDAPAAFYRVGARLNHFHIAPAN